MLWQPGQRTKVISASLDAREPDGQAIGYRVLGWMEF
jgi:hypothetical protein